MFTRTNKHHFERRARGVPKIRKVKSLPPVVRDGSSHHALIGNGTLKYQAPFWAPITLRSPLTRTKVFKPIHYRATMARRLRGLGSQWSKNGKSPISGSELRAHGERCRPSVRAMALAAALVQVIV